MEIPTDQDRRYLEIIKKRVEVCKAYTPKFGQGASVSLEEFAQLYGADPFYSWFGLNNPLMYAAHKAAGGITSLYRQIGTGCEQVFRQIIRDNFQVTAEQAGWSYVIQVAGRKDRKLSLDGRIAFDDLKTDEQRERVHGWVNAATESMGMDKAISSALKGAVFEVRQGYKSKDSKRQNADIGNAGTAYAQGYLPVVVILSTQIDGDIAARYASAGWLLLRGYTSDSSISSTYAFCRQVLGYDLAAFFQKYSEELRNTVDEVLHALLSPDTPDAVATELTGELDDPEDGADSED